MRRLSLPVLALIVVLAFPAAASARFTLGVAAGEITSSTAKVWAHATSTQRATVQVATDRRFNNIVGVGRVTPRRADDLTVQATLRRLRPGRTYFYRWMQGQHDDATFSRVGRFETAPRPNADATVRFGYTGDADATRQRGARRPFFNTFGLYARMQRERNDFNFNFGDTIYSDSEVGARFVNGVFIPASVARTVSQKWGKYRQNLGQRPLANLRGSTGIYSHWDDHEFINDFSRAEDGNAIYRNGVTAFRDYAPVTYTSRDGLYRRFRWGANLEIFMLDQRSFRSAKASQGGTCDNPDTRAPDLGPTAPQQNRNVFAAVAPSLARPVSPACLARISDPNRTMLGQRQFRRFVDEVERSNARWKVVMNETPIQQYYILPYDRWEGYAAERQRLLEELRNNQNVVFLTTDTHANFVNDVRFQTLEPGGPINTGMFEVVTGPVATNTFSKEIDEVVNRPNTGQLVTDAFLKPAPPNGVGMRCVNADIVSYSEVEVTRNRLSVVAKDINGRPVLDASNRTTPCRLDLSR